MAQRLVEQYELGVRVEILLLIDDVEEWRTGEVVGQQHPAVWVRTDGDHKLWFVTNGKRIRPVPPMLSR